MMKKPCIRQERAMYKKERNRQYCITDFDQPMGMKLDPENR